MKKLIKTTPNEIRLKSITIDACIQSVEVSEELLKSIKKEAKSLFDKGWLVEDETKILEEIKISKK